MNSDASYFIISLMPIYAVEINQYDEVFAVVFFMQVVLQLALL
jgi:hypothetical protein